MGKRIAILTATVFSGLILIAVITTVVITSLSADTVPVVEQTVVIKDDAALPTACDFAALVGKKLQDVDLKAFDQRPVRVLHPDSVMTMDYSAARINIKVDANDVVTEVTCG